MFQQWQQIQIIQMKYKGYYKMEWKRKDKLNFVEFTKKIETLSKEVVKNQLSDINSKLNSLKSMGIVMDEKKFDVIQNKIQEIKNDIIINK